MEKRVAGIIRWLERCLEAHKAGELENALMDVECARADMDILRNGFWSKLDRGRTAKRRRALAASFFAFLFKTALVSAAVILATAAPLALPRERLWREKEAALEQQTAAADIANANADAKIDAKRSEAVNAKSLEAMNAKPPEARPLRSRPLRARVLPSPAEARQDEKPGMNLSYENILALVETGEKALKNEKPAIEIEGRNRRGFSNARLQ